MSMPEHKQPEEDKRLEKWGLAKNETPYPFLIKNSQILSTLKSEVEKMKLPVPNPYGKWVKIENVNKIVQQVIDIIERQQSEG